MSLRVQAARGLKWQAVEILCRQVLSLLIFTTLARLLDPSAFGLVGLVAVYLAFVQVFAEQGLSAALVQRKDLHPRHLDAAFWFNLLCGAALCLATMVLARPVAGLFGEPQLATLLRWASPVLVINALGTVQGAVFAREMDFRSPALRTIVANFVGGGVGVGLAVLGFGVWALIAQQLCASSAGVIFLWTASSWRPARILSWAHLKELMAVSGSVFATSFLWFFSTRADQMIIGRVLGTAALGQYGVATKLSDLARTTLYQPLGAVSLPALSRLQGDRERFNAAVCRAMEVNALISFPCLLGLSAVANDLVPLLLGEKWVPAAHVLQILAFYVLANGLQGISHNAILASGGAGGFLRIGIIHGTGVIAACLLGIRFGNTGVAVGLLANEVAINIPRLSFLKKKTGITPGQYLRPCLGPAVAGCLMYATVLAIQATRFNSFPTWRDLIIEILCAAFVYTGIVAMVARRSLTSLIDLGRQTIQRKSMPAIDHRMLEFRK